MKLKPTIRLFIVLVFLVPVAAWLLLSWYEKKLAALPVLGKPITQVESSKLYNQDSLVRNMGEWKNNIVLVDFFFTHCPAICPKMTNNLKTVQETFAGDSNFQIASFSVDPVRDSPARLREYMGRFGLEKKNWDFITGDKKLIYQLARNTFTLVATDGDGGPDDFIHSEQLVLIDKKGRIRGYYKGTSETEVKQLITDIKKLKHENQD